ncbi:hypothetical protein OAU50_06080 [Planctomycetota bacterium]|nr:hypothetical protein [Planctomycetota bacterium]
MPRRQSLFSKLNSLMKETDSDFAKIKARRSNKSKHDAELFDQVFKLSKRVSALALLSEAMHEYMQSQPQWDESAFEDIVSELDTKDGVLDGMIDAPNTPRTPTKSKLAEKFKKTKRPEPEPDEIVLPRKKRFPKQPDN